MSLNSIISTATSGLFTSQSGLGVVSRNIANVNTPGYARIEQYQEAVTYDGSNAGVDVSAIRRATDRFLEASALNATSTASMANVQAEYLDQLQAAFGDPSESNSLFSVVSEVFSAFETAAATPNSALAKSEIVTKLNNAISQLSNASNQVTQMQQRVDSDIVSNVDQINGLLKNIVTANSNVTRGTIQGDSTGAQEVLSGYINQLSELVGVRVDYQNNGTANVYLSDGTFLAGSTASVLSYSGGNQSGTYESIKIQVGDGSTPRNIETSIQSGTLRGLLDLRDNDLATISEDLSQFSGKFADAINAAYNLNASIPAITSTTGNDTGLLGTDSLGFTGQTSIGLVDSTGVLQSKINIDFDAGTISVNGGGATSFGGDINGFVSALNSALGSNGTASFTNGKLSIDTSASGNGMVFDEPATNCSLRGDKAFAHFFGLNNLISSNVPTSAASGIKSTDTLGFAAGDNFTLKLSDENGKVLAEKTIAIPGGTFGDLVNTMNDPMNGLGLYGTFILASDGSLSFTANNQSVKYNLDMTDDSGFRGTTSVTAGQLLGLADSVRQNVPQSLSVNKTIAANPSKLGLATADLANTAVGSVAIGVGDATGAKALTQAFDTKINVNLNGGLSSSRSKMSLSDYMSVFAGSIATKAANAESIAASATTFKSDATSRLSNKVGVNLDEELVKLTQYQQAYSASARMLRAADEMYQTLLDTIS